MMSCAAWDVLGSAEAPSSGLRGVSSLPLSVSPAHYKRGYRWITVHSLTPLCEVH